ncbi:MAG: prevent-host-death family protein [Planctomycetes bacterium]|nr:prevent-host-death family protein [Planctomycetota bacterium]
MRASILDLRRRMGDILKAIDRRESVVISYRGKDRAILHPLPETSAEPFDPRTDPAFGIWRDRDDLADPVAAVRLMREGRSHAL